MFTTPFRFETVLRHACDSRERNPSTDGGERSRFNASSF